MPVVAATASVDQIVRDVIRPVIARASEQIARSMAKMVVEQLEVELARSVRAGPAQARRPRRSSRRSEVTKWIADRRARRVPIFVIEATGLDTKKKIVARYGENAAFRKGKSPPPVKASGIASAEPKAARVVRAKPPILRKAASRK